jgi:hypothetical protein
MDRDSVAFLKLFGFADTGFDRHKVAVLFGKQGCLPRGFADPNLYRKHAPTIGYKAGYGFQVTALLQRNGHEKPGSRATPEPDYAIEFNVHGYSNA